MSAMLEELPWGVMSVTPGGPKRGHASLMRPLGAAPGAPFVWCRYAVARTIAAAINAAFCGGGVMPPLRLAAR